MKTNYILSENLTNTIVIYVILKKMMEDFEDWDAFKLGIIDKNGKKLKNPVTSKELEAWDLLTRFVWNFKKIILKFIGKSKMATYFSAAYLLKDSLSYFYISHSIQKLNESYLDSMSYKKQEDLHILIKEISKNHLISNKISEENFEYEMFRLIPKIEEIFQTFDIDKVL